VNRSLAAFLVATAVVGASAGTIRALSNSAAPRRIDVVIDARMGSFDTRLVRASKGDTVHVTVRAMDTAHGFKIQGRDDLDVTAYPGMPVEITFVVDWEGGREFYCTFSCGNQHATMTGMIISERRDG
jgi:heme/copper-type cytochrome/quinol oxidase subunit 2